MIRVFVDASVLYAACYSKTGSARELLLESVGLDSLIIQRDGLDACLMRPENMERDEIGGSPDQYHVSLIQEGHRDQMERFHTPGGHENVVSLHPHVLMASHAPRDPISKLAVPGIGTVVESGGTFLNGRRVFCTDVGELAACALIVSRSEEARGEIDPLRPRLREIRPVGSVAYKLAAVAAGLADMNVSVQPKNEWDVCAGDLLVREAGGRMVDLNGQVRLYNQSNPLIGGGLVAGNPTLTGQMLTAIEELYP